MRKLDLILAHAALRVWARDQRESEIFRGDLRSGASRNIGLAAGCSGLAELLRGS